MLAVGRNQTSLHLRFHAALHLLLLQFVARAYVLASAAVISNRHVASLLCSLTVDAVVPAF